MGSVVDAHAESIHELAAEPASHTPDAERDNFDEKDSSTQRVGRGVSRPPHEREESHYDHVAAAVEQANALGTGPRRNSQPVDEPEDRGQQAADDTPGDVPIADRRERRIAA